MEILKTNNPKSDLLKKSSRQREELEREIQNLGDQTEKALTNILVVGGALAITYLIVRQFTSKPRHRSKSKKLGVVSEPTFVEEEKGESRMSAIFSEVGAVLATQATAFLLALAKEKLTDYLETQGNKKKEKNEHS